MYDTPKILSAGDRALVVEFGDAIDVETSRRVHDLASRLEALDLPAVRETIPTYRSLLVSYDPLAAPLDDLHQAIWEIAIGEGEAGADAVDPPGRRLVHIPTLYGSDYGPDIGLVASNAGMSPEDVIAAHTGVDYLVHMIGFSPGFPYLGGLDERLATPRLESPRTETPAGSVGIAEGQTGVYPVTSPGGWRIIGRTPVRLFDPSREPPAAVTSGNYVRFVPLRGSKEYRDLERKVQSGKFELSTETVA